MTVIQIQAQEHISLSAKYVEKLEMATYLKIHVCSMKQL